MLEDLLLMLKVARGNYSKNPRTSIGRGRNIVRKYLPYILFGLALSIGLGFIQIKNIGLLAIYGIAPLVLDSSLVMETMPIVSRFVPRAIIILEFGTEVVVGISLGAMYAIYRGIGALSMGWGVFKSRRDQD